MRLAGWVDPAVPLKEIPMSELKDRLMIDVRYATQQIRAGATDAACDALNRAIETIGNGLDMAELNDEEFNEIIELLAAK